MALSQVEEIDSARFNFRVSGNCRLSGGRLLDD